MSYSTEQRWGMFLGNLRGSPYEALRHAAVLIERDRWTHGMTDSELRANAERGKYGSDAQELWNSYKTVVE